MQRYALVGAGHRAGMYVRALAGPHAHAGELVAILDPNDVRIGHHRQVYGRAPAGYHPDDFDAMLCEQRPSTVIVTTVDRWHADYVVAALAAGCSVICEKPLTTDAEGCRRITEAARTAAGTVAVTFNYRYSPRNSGLKQLLLRGAVGEPTSVHFEWLLDTNHGADYFRRWHRDKASSGGLFVHKATHHFDLVNWWLDDIPATVTAAGGLRFYGAENAAARGLGPRPARSHGAATLGQDPFLLDLAADPELRALYLDAEQQDGYLRDQDVFAAGITIEDNLAVLARYRHGALLTYSLNAHGPWEGYRVAVNGTEGRLELDVVERGAHEPPEGNAVRPRGERLVLQRHWRPAEEIDLDALAAADPCRPPRGGDHGGGDQLLLDDLFRGPAAVGPDPLRRAAGVADGVRSVLVGVAANRSLETGGPVDLADLGVPL